MQSNLIGKEVNELDVFFLAGLATAPHFMENLRHVLIDKLQRGFSNESLGQPVYSEQLFPYGDWGRRVIPQLWEIRSDMRLGVSRIARSIGGNRALNSIRSARPLSCDRPRMLLLIGHSGGGIAAVHAAQLLLDSERYSACLVVMIGSPKCRIPESLRPSVLSISAAGRTKGTSTTPSRSPDIVSRLGTFGGWAVGNKEDVVNRRLPSWLRDKHAPATRISVPIIGGHADYFRERVPFVNQEGRSNLDLTLEAILTWLIQWN
ncbi:hypothetical protein [Cohnella sp. WQ 127256]|uniref:hypothetical protein n=1 Tax=Cohnella sp. WQ 127256 TaxID=2938790 RepID=UPI002117B6F9|nr:hypothetical protein [Cohnella sp. WQ 127256]